MFVLSNSCWYERERTSGAAFVAHETRVRRWYGRTIAPCDHDVGLQPTRHILSIQALRSLKWPQEELNLYLRDENPLLLPLNYGARPGELKRCRSPKVLQEFFPIYILTDLFSPHWNYAPFMDPLGFEPRHSLENIFRLFVCSPKPKTLSPFLKITAKKEKRGA